MVLEEKLIHLFSSCLVDIRTLVNTIDDVELRRSFIRILIDYRNKMENLNEEETD